MHIALARCGLLLQTVSWFVGRSVCLTVNPAKAAEPIVMPFGKLILVSTRNRVLNGVQNSSSPICKGQFFLGGGKWRPVVKYRDPLP